MLQAWTQEEVCTTLSEGHYSDDGNVGLSSGTILEVTKRDVKGLSSREQPVGELEMLVASEAELNAELRLNTHIPDRTHNPSYE